MLCALAAKREESYGDVLPVGPCEKRANRNLDSVGAKPWTILQAILRSEGHAPSGTVLSLAPNL